MGCRPLNVKHKGPPNLFKSKKVRNLHLVGLIFTIIQSNLVKCFFFFKLSMMHQKLSLCFFLIRTVLSVAFTRVSVNGAIKIHLTSLLPQNRSTMFPGILEKHTFYTSVSVKVTWSNLVIRKTGMTLNHSSNLLKKCKQISIVAKHRFFVTLGIVLL